MVDFSLIIDFGSRKLKSSWPRKIPKAGDSTRRFGGGVASSAESRNHKVAQGNTEYSNFRIIRQRRDEIPIFVGCDVNRLQGAISQDVITSGRRVDVQCECRERKGGDQAIDNGSTGFAFRNSKNLN